MAPKLNSYPVTSSLVLYLLISLSTACVSADDYVPPRDDIFAPLHHADLAEFDYRLSLDEHAGRDDAYTAVGRALFDLATCRDISDPPAVLEEDPEALLAYELVRLEQKRRSRLVRRYTETERHPWHASTIHEEFSSPHFFDTEADVPEGDLIEWPDLGEGWPDEWPAPRDVSTRCDDLIEHRRDGPVAEPFHDADEDSLAAHLVDEWLQTRRVDRAVEHLDDDSPLKPRVQHRIGAHRADLVIALRNDDEAMDAGKEAIAESTDDVLDELQRLGGDDPPVDLDLRAAWLAIAADDDDTAVDALVRLTDHPDDGVADAARYYAVQLAWLDGDWETAAALGDRMIDGPAELRSAYAYFAATAHQHVGNDEKFFGLSRDALQGRSRDAADPFAGSLYRQLLRELVRFDVDDRTTELLEEFGPRAELSTRIRELAEVAVDMGYPDTARQLAEPLLDDTRDARKLPRIRATLALAAFLEDDRDEFDHHVEQLLHRPDQLEEAIPRERRAAFFAHRDTELARVLRATLPLMAQWGDDPGAQALRQQWLEVLVEQTRTFLRTTPESAVSEDLAELYRLAGRLLDDHPRGYAERVGEEEPSASALVLGTVDMPPTPPLDEAPRPQLRWPEVPSLLLIPSGGVPPDQFTNDLEPDSESL